MFYFGYEVNVWDNDLDKEVTYQGVVCGREFQDAAYQVSQFFGEEEITSMTIEAWDAEGCLVISKEALEDIKQNLT